METPQIPWSSRTVEWQSGELNALQLFGSRSKLCLFCCGCPLEFVHVSIIITHTSLSFFLFLLITFTQSSDFVI